MKNLVSRILDFMINNNVISTESYELDFYRYGIEITLSSLINVILIFLIGIIAHRIYSSIIFLVVFILMRSLAGGFHADTYLKCNLITSLSFILLLVVYEIITKHFSLNVVIFIAILQSIIVALLSPIENINKPIGSKVVYKIISTFLSLSLSILSIVLIINGNNIGLIVLLTLALVSILMVFAKLLDRRNSYEN
ncbi:accessory gene regulator B family protein [Ruminococcus sp. Marseille-P6503]|uniref:accessory gene regulator B family protein n=1 Tax=Ruminococcus sp. Marseille-P6503 TaxID=2364796 RepID=UPI000F532A14|nr:accessory gene regulator B family protein [Ruminococcus sp. Marseille-P6503]